MCEPRDSCAERPRPPGHATTQRPASAGRLHSRVYRAVKVSKQRVAGSQHHTRVLAYIPSAALSLHARRSRLARMGQSFRKRSVRRAVHQRPTFPAGLMWLLWTAGRWSACRLACHGRDLPAQSGAGVALAEVGQVILDQGRVGRHGREVAGSAPLGEASPVRRVGSHRRGRVGGDAVSAP